MENFEFLNERISKENKVRIVGFMGRKLIVCYTRIHCAVKNNCLTLTYLLLDCHRAHS